jgi:hypothetical protein
MRWERTRQARARGNQRAQTALDFAIGVSVFLIVIVGVLAFVPSVFGGTGAPADGEIGITANRVAGFLAGDGFAPAEQPNELKNECVLAFFADTADCGFGAGNGVASDVGVSENRGLNVTVQADLDTDPALERVCWDASGNSLVTAGNPDCDTPYTAGPVASRNDEFETARRTSRLGGIRVFVVVRAW